MNFKSYSGILCVFFLDYLLMFVFLFIGTPRYAFSAEAACKYKKGIVILGDNPHMSLEVANKFLVRSLKNTAEELNYDFRGRGYSSIILITPTIEELQRQLEDPCVKAFGFVGEGSDADSEDTRISFGIDGDYIFLSSKELISPFEVREMLGPKEMELVIIHACYQGAKNNAMKWREAFNLDKGYFKGWRGKVRYFEIYWWQFLWK